MSVMIWNPKRRVNYVNKIIKWDFNNEMKLDKVSDGSMMFNLVFLCR